MATKDDLENAIVSAYARNDVQCLAFNDARMLALLPPNLFDNVDLLLDGHTAATDKELAQSGTDVRHDIPRKDARRSMLATFRHVLRTNPYATHAEKLYIGRLTAMYLYH